ncbi:MAG: S9 family peptidase [Dehalococcoidia bacterium]|jgi:dipeptidyl aminopeptidase/acylaminoacyl peptidase|nr:S9 family peptidase [Dehalococcoidia bacterium]
MGEPTVEDFVRVETALEPRFSSDGARVAFRWNRPGVSQAFVVDAADGGAGRVARQLTDTGGVTYGLAMRPGHNELMYIADDGGDEQFQLHLIDLDSAVPRALASAPGVIHNFGSWSVDGRLVSYGSNKRARQFFDVYVLNVETGAEHLVYQQDGMNGAGVFAADGRSLQIGRPNLDLPGDNDLFVVALDESGAAAGEVRRVTEHEASAERASQWTALHLTSEGTLLVLSDEGREFVGLARIGGTSGAREYLAEYDWDIEAATVSSDGSRIALVINEDGYSRIEAHEVGADGFLGVPIELPALPARGIVSTPSWRGDGGALAFTFEGPRHLSDVWIAEVGTDVARRLSASASGAVDVDALPEPELVRYTSFEGREIPAFYYRPTSVAPNGGAGGAADGERVPCLVLVHGGPEGQSRPALWGRYSAPHYLLTQGVALLVPNVRGSTGYGKEYCHADDVELRMDSVRDLIAATEWLAGTGEIDPERIGVMGGSYGGFMVLAAITEAPERWGAAIDLFGIADFETFLKFTGPWRRKHRAREYGEDPEFLRTISPIHRAGEIQTPLLVIQGDHDVRVPQEESEQIVDTVRRNEGIVEYVVYPEEGHGIQKLPHRLDMGERIAAFCREHLLGEGGAG